MIEELRNVIFRAKTKVAAAVKMKQTPKTANMKLNNLENCSLEFAEGSHVVCCLMFSSYLVVFLDSISKHRLSCPPTISLIVNEG